MLTALKTNFYWLTYTETEHDWSKILFFSLDSQSIIFINLLKIGSFLQPQVQSCRVYVYGMLGSNYQSLGIPDHYNR